MAIPEPYDLHSAPTQPLDRADLALTLAVQHLRAAYDEIQRAMRYRHELDVALFFVPHRLRGVVQEITQEIQG